MRSGSYAYGHEDLTPGVIDWKAQAVFTEGQCHALALELHKETNWPLVGLFNSQEEIDEGTETPYHTCVLSPDGIVDILGIGADCRLGRQGRTVVSELTEEGVLRFKNKDYAYPNRRVAKHFVQAVLNVVQRQKMEGDTEVCSSLPSILKDSK